MIVKLLKHYGMSPPGTILPLVSKPIADLLIQRGVAVLVVGTKKKAKTAKSNQDDSK